MVNKNFANAIGAEITDEEAIDADLSAAQAITVFPNEIVEVENADLPNMADINLNLAIGEKQLEQLIDYGLAQVIKMFNEAQNCTPDKLSRFLEVAQATYGQTLAAIVHKNNLQLEKKKLRMKEDSYSKTQRRGNVTNNNILVGTREELLKLMASVQVESYES